MLIFDLCNVLCNWARAGFWGAWTPTDHHLWLYSLSMLQLHEIIMITCSSVTERVSSYHICEVMQRWPGCRALSGVEMPLSLNTHSLSGRTSSLAPRPASLVSSNRSWRLSVSEDVLLWESLAERQRVVPADHNAPGPSQTGRDERRLLNRLAIFRSDSLKASWCVALAKAWAWWLHTQWRIKTCWETCLCLCYKHEYYYSAPFTHLNLRASLGTWIKDEIILL